MTGDSVKEEKGKLLDIVLDKNQTLKDLEKKFKSSFKSARYNSVVDILSSLLKEFIDSCEGVGLISSLFIVDVVRAANVAAADALLFDVLVELEKGIRKDMFLAEQLKYASKESKENKKGLEASFADGYRIHSVAKTFTFDLLANTVKADEKPEIFLKKSQEELDAELGEWEKNPTKLKDALATVSQQWCSQKEKQKSGSLLESAAIFDSQSASQSAMTLSVPSCTLPTAPVCAGEIRLLFPSAHPFAFDSQPATEGWKTAQGLLASAQKGPLSADDEKKLESSLTKAIVWHLGADNSVLINVATHNPKVCGILLTKMESPARTSSAVQSMLKASVPRANIEDILLSQSEILEQGSIQTYINECLLNFKGKDVSADDKKNVKESLSFLHKLISASSEQNKELYVAEGNKSTLVDIFKKCEIPDDVVMWNQLAKK